MKKLLALLILFPLSLLAVNPSYTSFDGTQFVTNGPSLPISIKNGALATNITFVGPFNIVDPSNTNNAVFQYVPGLSQITLNNQGLISGGTITAVHFVGDGAGISNVIARGPFTNMTIWASNNGPSLTFNQPTNDSVKTLIQLNTTNGLANYTLTMTPGFFATQQTNDYTVQQGFNAVGSGILQQCYDQWEPYFINSPGSNPQVERWWGCSGTNQVQLRPLMYTCDYSGFITLMQQADQFRLYPDKSRSFSIMNVDSTNTLEFDAATVSFRQCSNGVTIATSATNKPAQLNLTTALGAQNLNLQIGVSGQSNDLLSGVSPGDAVIIDNGTNLFVTIGGNTMARFRTGGSLGTLLDLNAGLRTSTGGNITGGGGLTNSGSLNVEGNGVSLGADTFIIKTNSTGLSSSGAGIVVNVPMNGAANNCGMYISAPGSGSGGIFQQMCRLDYTAGYTGTKESDAMVIFNRNAGTGASLSQTLGNFTIHAIANGSAASLNSSIFAEASGGNLNAAVLGIAITSKNSAANVGVMGYSINGGSSPTNIGGAFFLATTPGGLQPFPTNTALYVDSGGSGKPIAVFATNGVSATVPGTIVAMVDADGSFNGNGSGLTNIPPASITGRSYVQTNFVLNTVYAAPNGPFTTVAGTAIITAAAAVGNVELDVMYQAGGSGTYTAISAPSLTTTVLSIVMPYQIPFSATITNGNYYLTNSTTTAGGNATLKSGTGTLTTF